ncbi:MAG TPA: hypothetical protein V6D19_15020 [Stenomitos sp.]
MKDKDEQNPYLPHRESDKDRYIVEVPLEARMPKPERLPSGFEPIQSIGLEGQAFRGLAGGRVPWWILITGWVIFGGWALFAIGLVITSSAFLSGLPLLFISGVPILILWRGTAAKFKVARHRNRRR